MNQLDQDVIDARKSIVEHQQHEQMQLEQRVREASKSSDAWYAEQQRQEQDAEAAREKAHQEREQARIQAEMDSYRRQARAVFIGTDQDFDATFPHLWADYQRDEAQRKVEAQRVAMRHHLQKTF